MNLRKTAKLAPYCFGCGLQNPNGDLLCLAHSNALKDGRGIGHKSHDEAGAILCHSCHDYVDGRAGGASKEAKRAFHEHAAEKTRAWWQVNGYI